MDLVTIGLFERLNDQLAFDGGNDFELWILSSPMKELPRENCDISRTPFARRRGQRRETACRGAFAGDFGGQITQKNRFAFGHHERPAENVFEFAHISGPMIFLKRFDDSGTN